MAGYEYGRIRKLARSLEAHGVDPAVRDDVMAGGTDIKRGTSTKKKAAWMAEAMARMDATMDVELRRAVREACACCLGGKRGKLSKAIAREQETLEARVAAANETPFVFGHSVTLQDDGRVMVRFQEPGHPGTYRCVCLKGMAEPMSDTYCMCCGGHVKHHLQRALDHPLRCAVVETALTSAGEAPCTFLFEMVGE